MDVFFILKDIRYYAFTGHIFKINLNSHIMYSFLLTRGITADEQTTQRASATYFLSRVKADNNYDSG